MTSIQTDVDSPRADRGDRAQTFLDWTRINARALTGAGIALIVLAAAIWFYQRSRVLKAEAADRALMNAEQSMQSGNLPLAQSDLQKVYSSYANTSAGVRAGLLLAQMDYDANKYQDGVTLLQKLPTGGAAADAQYSIHDLLGDGEMQMGKASAAVKSYLDASNVALGDLERSAAQAKAARAYLASGDSANARKMWETLANDPKAATVAAEARVRLGELTARAVSK